MATQEIHALPMPAFPIHSEDTETPEVLARFICAICTEIGEEAWPDGDEYNDVAGKKLRDARIAPDGRWVCSQPCISQLMFQSANPRLQSSLKRYELALEMLSEELPEVAGALKMWECYHEVKESSVVVARTMLGVNERRRWNGRSSAPAWVEANVSPEETLRSAIGKALHDLDWRAMAELSNVIGFNNLFVVRSVDSPYSEAYKNGGADCAGITSRWCATALGTIGRVITNLKDALAGEVAQ